MNSELRIKKYNQEGDLSHEYNPLRNIVNSNDEISDFRTDAIGIDLNNPVNIECQPSYDGTVNLILNDDKNSPRIINTRFSTIEDNRYRIINRNQLQQTNLYNINSVDSQTRLFRNINNIPQIGLSSINYFGKLKGGNYTFYMKFADNDYNKTDIVCESGIVSIFKGDLYVIPSISGTLSDEITDKAIVLSVRNIDTTFQKIYLYYTRETSDLNGFRITETCMISKPYEIKDSSMNITINGYENVEIINEDELNINYNIATAVKTQAQVQNMLFFGNIQGINLNYKDLQNISLYIKVGLKQSEDSIGYVGDNYKSVKTDDVSQNEYYNPLNIYYKLGYWPGEIYRLGIVYQLTDDSLSPVFNLRGCRFENLNNENFDDNSSYHELMTGDNMNYIPQDEFILEDRYLDNTKGVFRNPDIYNIIDHTNKTVKPWYYEIKLSSEIQQLLKKYKVKGYFIVRQKRIPITLCQGLSIGVDRISNIPMLYDQRSSEYISESFINSNKVLTNDYNSRKIVTPFKQTSGIISLETNVNPLLKSVFDGSPFTLQKLWRGKMDSNNRMYFINDYEKVEGNTIYAKLSTVFVDSDVPLKYVNDIGFSTRAGSAEDVKGISFFGTRDFSSSNYNIVRGLFCPFLGLSSSVEDNCIYNIRIQNYSTIFEREYFSIRGNDNSAFYAISDRHQLMDVENTLNVYRGDCYTSNVTIRMHRNFIDSSTPTNNLIVDTETWKKNYKGYDKTNAEQWLDINRGDLNAVLIGTWITYKCLSNQNLGLRSEDTTNTDEMAIMGNPRTFYPFSSASVTVSNKIEESWLLNGGYGATVSQKRNLPALNVPYIKDMFDNRVMFSNVQVDDDFKNAYRVFQGLSYKDIDRQYGAIVKLIPWGVNLFCVFEHGLAIIPINEKALISTNTGQSIHMYGADVLQNQVSLISPDFGSIWQESIIRTPIGIYGVDTHAKKIWRFSEANGLELISDMKIQRFLNDNIKLQEKDKYPTIALKNVKTHFNNYKGDVLFTFYNDDESAVWHLCYNERINNWITQYSWVPLYSENINNIFYTLDKKRAEILSYIFDNQHTGVGINLGKGQNQWNDVNTDHVADIKIVGYDFYDRFEYRLNWIKSSYIDKTNEIFITIPNSTTIISDNKLIINKDSLEYDNHKLYYLKLNVSVTPVVTLNGTEIKGSTFSQHIGIVVNRDNLSSEQKIEYDLLLRNGFFVHGQAGIFDEIDYTDDNPLNQITPTKWYNKQESFEFEFVVNNLTGFHKIFNDLVIISNNVAPKELEFEIIGDVYDFNKAGIYQHEKFGKDEFDGNLNPRSTSQEFLNTTIVYDHVLNQYSLRINQPMFDMKTAGRVLGNLQYKEDSWYLEIEPISYKKKYKVENEDPITAMEPMEVRIRDKFLKVRVKYSGEDLAIITALKTFMTLSYS